jgi:Protein of unknown function (DUF1353)
MPFLTETASTDSSDGRNFTLTKPLIYVTNVGERIEIPIGATSDGASTPREIWVKFPPFGPWWKPAILHDYLYRLTHRPKKECDDLFYEAMESCGVSRADRDAIFEGVNLLGEQAFNCDRDRQLG